MQLSSLPGPLDQQQRKRLKTRKEVEGQSSTPKGQLCHWQEIPGLQEGGSAGRQKKNGTMEKEKHIGPLIKKSWHNMIHSAFQHLSHLEVSIKQGFAGVTWQWLPTGGRIRVGLSFWLVTQVILVIHWSPSLTVWGILRAMHICKYKKLVSGNLSALEVFWYQSVRGR